MNAEPGFISDVFKELSKLGPGDRDCNLVFDSMAIRKEIMWDMKGSQYIGFCDYGNNYSIEGSEVPATEVLVFMLVSLNSKWKWPIGYFFVNKLKSCVQVQLIKSALTMASEASIRVRGVTCDGTQANLQTMTQLGCSIFTNCYESIRCYFRHPSEDYNVYFFPDACHNLKLARNALGTYMSFLCEDGEIQWSYIESLNKIQSSESLKLANKVSRAHIEWQRNPMKVKLAAQTLSSSVGDAIAFLDNSNVSEFEKSEATVHFIKVVDRIFDFLNSRSPVATGYKKPLSYNNIEYLEESLTNDVKYLFTLKDKSGQLLCHSRRKTFILGFATAVKSVFSVAKELFSCIEQPFKYILTYKFSQDHLEMLFARIRRRFGCNNNPNVKQFVCAMKQILQKNHVSVSSAANCIALSVGDEVGSIFEPKWKKSSTEDNSTVNVSCEMVELMDRPDLTDLKEQILYYISGFIVRRLCDTINCNTCVNSLFRENIVHNYSHFARYSRFLDFKDNGGLIRASESVYKVVLETEKQLSLHVRSKGLGAPNLDKVIVYKVKHLLGLVATIFPIADECASVTEVTDSPHKLQLISSISDLYLKLRLFSYGKFYSQDVLNPTSRRHQLNKLVLFNHM